MKPFSTLLIANRGEIAVRIAHTAKALGYRTVAVYSEADRDMPHVEAADIALLIGPPPAAQSYLDIDRIIAAARRSGADAIHPGYGFLSENDRFAQACADAGITFVGPRPDAIRQMGDKAVAKRLMLVAGVPCIPGYDGEDQSEAAMQAQAERIGYPLMVKATAGGGGKGIRLVDSPAGLAQALQLARSEGEKSFANGLLMLEKAVVAPRHVEVQVFADSHGNVVHIGDRDCSIQRRHQKVIEEAPAPGLPAATRTEMGEAAVKAARAVNYLGAGTVEFLVDPTGAYYFLEMNTRLQVEHPVTEMISGLNLVEWQLRVASGEPLPLRQDQIVLKGHAIEARLCAEDPLTGFLPQSGCVHGWLPASGPGIRVDHGIKPGAFISSHYDPMIAKVIAHGTDRAQARRRLVRALEEQVVSGLPTNRGFLLDCLGQPQFINAELSTAFIVTHMGTAAAAAEPSTSHVALAAVLLHERETGNHPPTLRGWRSDGHSDQPILLSINDQRHALRVAEKSDGYRVHVDQQVVLMRLLSLDGPHLRVEIDGMQQGAHVVWCGDEIDVTLRGVSCVASVWHYHGTGDHDSAHTAVRAPMPGIVLSVRVKQGDMVEPGDILLVMEAMKMETLITARTAGLVTALHCTEGQQVPLKHVLIEIEPAPG